MDDVIKTLEGLKGNDNPDDFYEALGPLELLVSDYGEYLKSRPVDCEEELKRLPNAGFRLSCAMMTMLLREDYFSGGMFAARAKAGMVDAVLDRMIVSYTEKHKKD